MALQTESTVARTELLRLCVGLAEPEQRTAAIREISGHLGIDTFVLFLTDPEVGTLLVATGFPQTLPDGLAWRAFLAECQSSSPHRGTLPWPDAHNLMPALGLALGKQAVLVLIGGNPTGETIEDFGAIVRVIVPGLACEQVVHSHVVQLGLARQVARETSALASSLDEARRAAQEEIAARKRIESALLEAKGQLAQTNRDLEARVNERTEQLQATVSELEAFSYSISHDMRAPLRSMQGFAAILMEEAAPKLDARERDLLERIHRAAQRLDRLIYDVLRYSRIARTEVSLVPLELEALLADVIQQYPTLQPGVATIEVHSPLPRVLGHEVLLVQCLSNLLVNAVKFAAPGVPPRVVVRAEETGSTVRLWIEDNGIGIDPRHHRTIFGIFERIDSSSPVEGTGIGLAIVKRAVMRLGGEVGVESAPGGGSRFWLTLQRA